MESLLPKPSIKHHILLLTVLPSLLVTALLTSYFVRTQQSDAQDELIRQVSSTIKYLSKSSELALFTGDKEELYRLVWTINANDEIKSVIFFNQLKEQLLTSGEIVSNPTVLNAEGFYKKDLGNKWLFQMPVYNSQKEVSDFSFSENQSEAIKYLGWVQILADKRRLHKKQRSILITGASIGIIIFMMLSALAHRFSRSITKPLDKITKTIQEFESGNLSARVDVAAKGELESLVTGINRLAEKVELSNESLQKRVDQAVFKLTQTLGELEDKNNKLKQTGIELTEANKAKDDFLASMSHELRTPLTAILGYSRILKKTKLEKKQSEHIDVIQQASTMLLSLIDNILDFSKLKTQSIELEHVPFSLESLLEEVLDLHLPEAQGKGIKLMLTVGLDVPFELIGDELRIKQIINNLVRNAIKFTSKGSVEVSVSLLDSTDQFGLLFKVKDTGIGMDITDPADLFQPFFQAEPSISRRFGGTGLGLMICKNLVNLFAGDINISSEKGKGTEVIFSILKIDKQKEIIETQALIEYDVTEHSNVLAGTRVLIAEDNIFIKELLKMILKSEGATVISVDNGKKALKKCHKYAIDLLLLDYNMPGLNGYETCKLIRNTFSAEELPVFLITADILNVRKLDLKAVGIDEIIYKPINEQKLLQTIVRYTSKSETPVIQQKVMDFLPDEVIFRELERLCALLQQAVNENNQNDIKKYAHEICGIAGPTTKYNEIESMARKIERIAATNMAKENYNQVIVLLVELNTVMKSSKKQGGWV